jgi:prepilin-type N-terminal cleavage/methylation domain-containing protein
MKSWARQTGFTIVELLIVIVVIAILAAISIVAYNGIQDRAKNAVLASDLANAAKQLKIDQIDNGDYPATIAAANNGSGLKASTGTNFTYEVNNSANPKTFSLTANNGTLFYFISESSSARPNIAKGVSSSSSLLTDGVVTSSPYFSMSPGLQSVTVDLGGVYDVSAIKVWHYHADARTYYATRTEVSTDNSTWTTVFNSGSSGTYAETPGGKTITFSSRPVRYIRDWLNGSTANTGNHWVEIQAY